MFDERNSQIDQGYIQTSRHAIDTTKELAKMLILLVKALKEMWDEKQERDKVTVKVGEEIYNLVEDKDIPGAYKWEKVDLNNDKSQTNETTDTLQYTAELEQPFTDYQAQTLATKLLTEAPDDNINYEDFKTTNPAIQITLSNDDEERVLYELSDEGKCVKNTFIEELSQEEIIDVTYETLSNIVPPNSPLLLPLSKDNVEESQKNLTISADDMLLQVVDELEIEGANEQFDADGLVLDDNNLVSNTNIEITTPTTLQTEQPKFDTDGLIVDDIDSIRVNIQSNEAIEQTIPAYVQAEFQEVTQAQFNTDSLIIEETDIPIAEEVVKQEFSTYNLEEETTIDTSTIEEFDADIFVVEETSTTVENTEVIDYIEPVVDDIGFANDIDISSPPEFDGPPDNEYEDRVTANEARFIAGVTAGEVSVNNNSQVEETLPIINKENDRVEEEASPIVKRTKTQSEEEPAANYTYREIASSPQVEPQAQQWARQSTVPIEEIKHRGEREKVELEKNKDIANAATEMLKKYGTIENEGSRIYRSDAFAIRKVDGVVSIHRRGDEAKGFNEPLMEFKLDKSGVPDIKGANFLNNLKRDVTQNDMLPVEKQEFLIVAERINEGKGLPNLQSGDVRETGNALGSLAPAGTLRTLETFKKSEMLEMLNSTLNQAKSDEVKAGEFTILRVRYQENNRASLVLTKDSDDGRGNKELVRFNLEKTPDGIKTEVAKMNVSDYDIGQVRHIAQNAYKLDNKNLESNFDNSDKQPQPQSNQTDSKVKTTTLDSKGIGNIPVNVHPWIAEEWQKMIAERPLWQDVMGQGNDEILQKLEENGGKLPIADQREMYDKIMMHKVTQAQASGDKDATIDFITKKDITADLMNERSRTIHQQFTPSENVSQKQAQAASQEVPRPVQRPVRQPQGVEL